MERLELVAGERQLVERAGDRLVAARRDHVREVLERAAAADRHLRLEAHDLDRERAEHVDEVLAQPAPVALRDRVGVARTRALSRATPSRSLAAQCRPVESPTMISTLPPPRSKHSAGPGIDEDRGADRGEDQPRLLEPVDDVGGDAGLGLDAVEHRVAVGRAAERARGAGEDLGRAGGLGEHPEPAHGLHRGVGRLRGDEPSRLTTSPSRSISFSRTSGSKVPSGRTSATTRWNEFDPRSTAAIRTSQ